MLYGDISERLGPDYTLVDSYEDGDLSEYDNTSTWAATTTQAADGSYGCEHTDTSFSTTISTSGLPAYPQQGDRWRVNGYVTDAGGSSAQYIGHYFAGNHYWGRINLSDQIVELDWDSGGDSASVSLSNNSWYEIEFEWDDGSTFGGSAGDITATFFEADGVTELATLSGNDTQFTNGGTGWFAADLCVGDFIRILNR